MMTIPMIFCISVMNCSGTNESDPAATSDFTYRFEGDCLSPVLEVAFSNLSQYADSYIWNFGDGTSSADFEPRKVYARSGKYTVTLKASNKSSATTFAMDIVIPRNSDGKGPQVQFTNTETDATKLEITFTAQSLAAGLFRWDFGDGLILEIDSTQTIHTYNMPGEYAVFLTSSNSEGSNCYSKTISVYP
jgi:PKD repeat protein